MSEIDSKPFPRFALIAAAVLMGGSIVAAAVGRLAQTSSAGAEATQSMKPLAARDLTFFDMDNGAVEVRDPDGEKVLYVVAPGTNGFIRGVMRGMARNRRAHDFGQETAFRLAEWPNGRLTLEDLATGKRIELSGFGAENRTAFAQLLFLPAGSTT